MEPKRTDDFLSATSESGHDDSLQDSSLRNLDLLSDVENLTERFSQQQDMITQIKEMAMAEEAARFEKIASTRLRMEKCTSQLAKFRDRARTNKKILKTPDTSIHYASDSSTSGTKSLDQSLADESILVSNVSVTEVSAVPPIASTANITTSTGKPKVSNREATKILHQQIKERKAMIAERTKNEKQLEEALMKMQKQLEENQNQSAEIMQIGQSKINFDFRPTVAPDDIEANKVVIELRNRIVQLESNILDLQETCKEKDSVIKSKTEAITLMSADMSMKGKNTLDLLDDTKEQMQKMQENFATMENNMKIEKQLLITELEACQNKVKYFEKANTILEDERFKLSIDNSDLEEKIHMKDIEITRINEELQVTMKQVEELLSRNQTVTEESTAEKGIVEISNMDELTGKIEALEEINALLKESNTQLQEELKSIKVTQMPKEVIRPTVPKSAAAENEYLMDVIKVLETTSQSLNKRILDVDLYLTGRESKIIQIKEEKSLNISTDVVNPEIIISNISNIDDDAELSLPDKIKELENLNYILKKSNIELENKLTASASESPPAQTKPSKPANKNNKPVLKGKAAAKAKQQQQTAKADSPKDTKQNEEFNNLWITIKNLGVFIESLRDQILIKETHLTRVDDEINKLNRECVTVPEIKSEVIAPEQVVDDNKPDESMDLNEPSMADRLDDAMKQIDSLSKEIADANKSMIKLKATHKTKVKQMQKSIDDFSKVSESNAELVRLQSLVDTLTQKVTELEDDKGNLQLHLVDYDSDRVSDSQLHAKLLEVERLAEERHKAIADLEMQKFDLVQELHLAKQTVVSLEDKVADLSFLENDHVSSELKCAQLEEELDSIKAENTKILKDVDGMISEKEELMYTIDLLNKDKSEINAKLELYIQENIELIDRLDKLSAEKVSSAESIEMVESLTSQEKMEIEQYQKTFNMLRPNKEDVEELKEDESFAPDNSEKSELLAKIELYSAERQEVIEKLEHYQSLNNSLNNKLQELEHEKEFYEGQYNIVKDDRDNVLEQVKSNETQVSDLNKRIRELTDENAVLSDRIKLLNESKTEDVSPKETTPSEKDISENVDSSQSQPAVRRPDINPKADKKNTKEILRLKGLIKNKDSEINTLNNKLTEILEGKNEHEELLKTNADLNEKLQQSHTDISMLNDQLRQIKEEKCNYDSTANDLNVVINTNVNKILKLEAEIKTKDDNISDLQNKLVSEENASKDIAASLESSIVKLINTMNDNEAEVNDLTVDLIEHLNHSDKIKALLEEFQRKTEDLSAFLSSNKNKIDAIYNEQHINAGKISQLQKECFNKDEKLKDVSKQLSEIDAKAQLIAKLESDVNRLNEECEEYRKRDIDNCNASQSIRLSEIEAELKIKTDMYTELESKLVNLSNDHQNTLVTFSESNNNAMQLKADFSALQRAYDSISSDLMGTKDEVNRLYVNLQDSQNKLAELSKEKETTVESYTQECNNLITQNNSLSNKLSVYEQQLHNVEQQNISHLEKLQEKTDECENMKLALSKMNILKDQIDGKQIEINDLIEQLEDVRSSYKEFQCAHDAKIQEREAFVESLEINLKKQQDKIVRLEENLLRMESLEKKINSLSTKLQDKDIIFAEKLQRENELDQIVSELTAQNKQLQKQLNQMQDDNSNLFDMNKNLNGTLTQFQADTDSLKSEVINLKNYLANYQNIEMEYAAVSEKYNRLQSELKDKASEYADVLKKKSTEMESLESSMQSQCDNFDSQTKQYKEHCKKMHDELSLYINKLKDAESEIANVKLENESLASEKEHLLKLHADEKKSSDDLIRLQNERDSFISMINAKENEIANYQQYVTQLQTESESVKATKQTYEETLRAVADKDSIIVELRNELSQLKTPPIKPVLVEEEIESKKVQHVDNASKYFSTMDAKQMQALKDLEDQIIASDSAGNKSVDIADNPMIRGFFHDSPVPVEKMQLLASSTDAPVEEEMIQSKRTYECFDAKVTELEESVKLLTDEKNKLANDLKQSQIKMNKALLKLKEYKLKYDSVSAELKKIKSSTNTNDLDFAIQDELYLQIKNLEDSLKEMKASIDKDKAEKDNLLKRVDVLTSANERLIAMKEKQDMEMQIYVTKNETLNKKLEIAQWDQGFDNDEFVKDDFDSKEKSQSFALSLKEADVLKEKIKILEADNDDLQSILDKQDNDLKLLTADNKKLKDQSVDKSRNELYEKENADLKNKLDDNNRRVCELNEKLLNCQDQLTKSSELVSSLHMDIEKGNNEIGDLKQRLESLGNDYASLEIKYNSNTSNNGALESEYNSAMGLVQELRLEIDKYVNLENEYRIQLENATMERDHIFETHNGCNIKISEYDKLIDSLRSAINEKSQEILNLQIKLDDFTNQTQILQDSIAVERDGFNTIRSDLEERIKEFELIPSGPSEMQLIESQRLSSENDQIKASSETQITTLMDQNKTLNDECNNLKRDLNESHQKLHEIRESFDQCIFEKSNLETMLESKDDDLQKYYNYEAMCNNKFNEFNALFTAKDMELSEKSEQFNLSLQAISVKDAEINNKNQEIHFLQEKLNDHDQMVQQISDLETKLADMDHEKEAELANLRLTLHSERTELEATISQLNDKINYLENQLDARISDCKNLNVKVDELQMLIDEESVQMDQMRQALESQEIEIVTLKENLLAHSDAYEKLRHSQVKADRHVSFSEDTKPGDESPASAPQQTNVMRTSNIDVTSSRADLDLALYMLHQRDVRCEELTVELIQLLEERDTLQLKLSNSIRTNEELRNRASAVHESSPKGATPSAASDDTVDETGEDATQSVIVTEPHRATSVEPSLESKLSQLHSVNYSRDVRVKDESENRQRQMELLQRDVQNLPAEAAAHLREAHYTLSRDTQSASTVLFNWLWGRTTPKVMHM